MKKEQPVDHICGLIVGVLHKLKVLMKSKLMLKCFDYIDISCSVSQLYASICFGIFPIGILEFFISWKLMKNVDDSCCPLGFTA